MDIGLLRLCLVFSSLLLLVEAGNNGMVYFLENRDNYLKQSTPIQGPEFSETDVAASVAVLLGVDPPVTKGQSGKLEGLLAPDPFNRPRRVVSLIVEGVGIEFLEDKNMSRSLGVRNAAQRVLSLQTSKIAAKHFGGHDIRLESLNHPVAEEFDVEFLKTELDEQFGISVELLKTQNDQEEIVILKSGGQTLQFDLSKRADYRFIADLLSLSGGLKRAVKAETEEHTAAELFFGTVTGLEALRQHRPDVSDATELLLGVISKIFQVLETISNEKLVGVVAFPSGGAHHVVREMIGKHYSARAVRYLKEEPKVLQAVEILSRRTLAASTSIILLVAAFLGTWCLCYMPLTRDSLLYAGAKLD